MIELIQTSIADRDSLCEELEQREIKTLEAVSTVSYLLLSKVFYKHVQL